MGPNPDNSRGLRDAQDAWGVVLDFMMLPHVNESPRQFSDEYLTKVKAAVQSLTEKRWMPATLDVFHDFLQSREPELKDVIDQYMSTWKSTRSPRILYLFINRLSEIHTLWCPSPVLGAVFPHRYHRSFITILHSMLPDFFPEALRDLLGYAITNSPFPLLSTDMNAADFPVCQFPHPTLLYLSLQYPNPVVTVGPPSPYAALFGALDILGFLERYESQLTACINNLIETRIKTTCPGAWDAQVLPEMKQWLVDNIVPWIARPYARGLANPDEVRIIVGNVMTRLEYHLCKTLCNLRMSELFDIIVDYPDSMPALLDIKECLTKIDDRLELVKALRKLNNRRLLHPGADTKDILTQYVSTIRCLRVIDPPGVLLYKVADPIRRYLRYEPIVASERPDTIRNIVASLVGEGGDLLDEHEQAVPLQQANVEDYSDPNWEPEPIDAGPDFRANKPADVLTTLVSIYDSKDLFVKELQVLLAQRLLVIHDGNDDRERKNIEILKLRFGDAALQVCEVMLRDMSDSRRIDQHIQSHNPSVVHPTIISANFWPSLQSSTLKMPGQFQSLQDEYAKEFATFKPDKQLRWLPHLGSVHLELELQDRKIETEATPLEAAIIELFSQKDIWTVNELVPQLGSVEQAPVVKALNVWVDKGVLTEESEAQYRLLEVSQGSSREPVSRTNPKEEEENIGLVTVQQQQAEQMRVHWKFIQGMLTNVGSLPLDRINSMLRFVPGYDRTPAQLGLYMESAKKEGLVTLKDGLWSLTAEGKATS
ncbi:hypothetical protein Clacol_007660 [Clathrus columnatus]|uniref:Anaphase-promoting complex subunit 2 n=1 Tax=Clathrus columnatus TaxID=1419009 RepID=A0AAV5AKD0_9AGAM|nr:hypothetical protein Clacol_007660 [Clathrus columnatus]